MLRSMYSGISGLRNHQTMMDVVGNNISNVNTAGFKGSSTVFQDVLSQTLQGAGAPGAALGGTNPAQIGLGSKVGAITLNRAQGSTQLTGRATDLAIQGDGFFAVRQGAETLFTRAGSFTLDANGTLSTPGGAAVQGWMAVAGQINTNGAVQDIRLPLGQALPPVQTGAVRLGGNLPGDAAPGTSIVTSLTVFDRQGAARDLRLEFTRGGGAGDWNVSGTLDGAAVTSTPGNITWDAGTRSFSAPSLNLGLGGGWTVGVALNDPTEPVTGYAGSNTLEALSQDGAAVGTLQSYTVGGDGTLVGVFSNGVRQPLGQVALGNFANPAGMEKIGNSLFRPTVNSGLVQLGTAGTGGRGALAGGTIEMSNVDLAAEFTNLIVAQRGFQANSRIITSSDELLQELVNLKR